MTVIEEGGLRELATLMKMVFSYRLNIDMFLVSWWDSVKNVGKEITLFIAKYTKCFILLGFIKRQMTLSISPFIEPMGDVQIFFYMIKTSPTLFCHG